tara:strand:- start:1186 stop:1917 length:732 start_codon:yes stop_codon:yes gene_type:complete
MTTSPINTETDFHKLAHEVWNKVHTQVQIPGILSLQPLANQIINEGVEGDVVEVGVWEGGCVAFLSKLFAKTDKTVWAVDSYEGFQDPDDGTYTYAGERHTPKLQEELANSVWIRYAPSLAVPIERVRKNLLEYDVGEHGNIKFLKGFVNETLSQETCPIEKISLLRIDVDAYSATKEVLEGLYDKVADGGFIIFDDWGVPEAQDAIIDFFKERGESLTLTFPHFDNPHDQTTGRYPYYYKKG